MEDQLKLYIAQEEQEEEALLQVESECRIIARTLNRNGTAGHR